MNHQLSKLLTSFLLLSTADADTRSFFAVGWALLDRKRTAHFAKSALFDLRLKRSLAKTKDWLDRLVDCTGTMYRW